MILNELARMTPRVLCVVLADTQSGVFPAANLPNKVCAQLLACIGWELGPFWTLFLPWIFWSFQRNIAMTDLNIITFILFVLTESKHVKIALYISKIFDENTLSGSNYCLRFARTSRRRTFYQPPIISDCCAGPQCPQLLKTMHILVHACVVETIGRMEQVEWRPQQRQYI